MAECCRPALEGKVLDWFSKEDTTTDSRFVELPCLKNIIILQ